MKTMILMAVAILLTGCVTIENTYSMDKEGNIMHELSMQFEDAYTHAMMADELPTEKLVKVNSTSRTYRQTESGTFNGSMQSGLVFNTYQFNTEYLYSIEDYDELGPYVEGQSIISMPGKVTGHNCKQTSRNTIQCELFGDELIQIESRCIKWFC